VGIGIPARSALAASTFALGLALVLGLAPSALAANLAPNPGFETVSPFQWSGSNATVLRVPNTPHSGAASMRVIADGTSTIAQGRSDCFAVTASTTYNLLVWYLASPPVTISFVGYGASYYSDAACASFLSSPAGASTSSPIIDGAWHSISGQQTAPGTAQSARLQINFTCVEVTCKTTTDPTLFDAVQYDDVVFDSSPLAVSVHSLTASRSHQSVLVRWRTGTEVDLLGFQVYRSRGHSWRRITHSLIATKGAVSGASYRYLDRTARRGVSYRYRIKAVEQDGSASWFGPVRVTT
jgi:hypothetical protein